MKINGEDYYVLPKEDFDFDPTKVEHFSCKALKFNDRQPYAKGSVTWIIDEVESKLNEFYGG